MNKCLLITGGTGKVGSQLVKHFFEKGYKVIFTSKTLAETKNLISLLNNSKANDNLLGIAIDLEKESTPIEIIKAISKKKLSPEVLINCARNMSHLKVENDGTTKRKEWLGELTLDVVVPYELSMALTKQKSSKLRHIINISSMYGVVPANPNLYENPQQESPIQYGVAKAALIHLTKELAIRLANKKIQVNAISYGGIEGRINPAFKKRYATFCPLGKMLKEEEVIGAVDFLVSNFSTNITGHNLVVDGGWSVW